MALGFVVLQLASEAGTRRQTPSTSPREIGRLHLAHQSCLRAFEHDVAALLEFVRCIAARGERGRKDPFAGH
jgi:hypothetical protein